MNSIIILSIVGLFSMIVGLFKVNKTVIFSAVIVGLLAAMVVLIYEWNTEYVYFNDMLFFDNYAIAFSVLLIFTTILIFSISEIFFENMKEYVTEHYALFVFSLIGMLCIVSFDHLSMLFVAIEIMSIPLYILAGSEKKNVLSNEASLKYFLMGAFATGLLLMGITLVYGETSTFHIDKISEYLSNNPDAVQSPMFYAGLILILAGLSFKVSIVPFHFWTPDVYQGSPTFVTTFMSTAVKVAGFAGFFRLFYYCFLPAIEIWSNLFAVMAVGTITIGGISAVFQTSLKRILAYSSISHAGYMLLIVLSSGATASGSILLYYGLAYSLSSIVSFAVIMIIQKSTQSDEIESFNGYAKVNPLMAFLLAVSMISLAGIPLTGGFFAKFYTLSATIEAGYFWVVLLAIINAIIGIYYYFKVIIAMYFKDNIFEFPTVSVSVIFKIVLIICTILSVLMGIFPDVIYKLI